MMSLKTPKILLTTVLMAGSFAAFAQTTTPAEGTTAVGVTKQEASKAIQKAVPSSNVATVVNNEPKATGSAATVTTTAPATTATATAATTMADAPPKMIKRKARADRN